MSLSAKLLALAAAIGADIKALYARTVPAGGATGQVLVKASNDNYAYGWTAIPAGAQGPAGATGPAGPGVPAGGTAGQVLTKTASADYATAWQTPAAGGSSFDFRTRRFSAFNANSTTTTIACQYVGSGASGGTNTGSVGAALKLNRTTMVVRSSATTANAIATEGVATYAQHSRLSGFYANIVFGFRANGNAADAGATSFAGLHNGSIPAGNASAWTGGNCVFFGSEAGETTLSLIHNDSAGPVTKVALGASFPVLDQLYSAEFEQAPNNGSITWKLTNLETGAVATGTIAANGPNFDYMHQVVSRNALATGASATVLLARVHVDSPAFPA